MRVTRRRHPSRHLFYSFVIGAGVTALGFGLAGLEMNRNTASTNAEATGTLSIAGSETLKPFLEACAEGFMLRHPQQDVVVKGGGSSNGVSALLEGQIDLAMSSRELSEAERQRGAQLGPGLISHAVATEAIAVLVHPAVPVNSTDTTTLAGLLSGTVSDWSALGAPASPVVVVGREAGSGTSAVIEQRILGHRSLAEGAHRLSSHEEVVRRVASTPGAIGYADVRIASREVPRVKLLALAGSVGGPAVQPEPTTVAQGRYPLVRSLHIVSRGPLQREARAFLKHCMSSEARASLDAAGFLPVQDGSHLAERPR